MSRRRPTDQWARLMFTPLEDRTTPASTATATATAGVYAVGVDQGQTGDVVVYNSDRTEDYRITTPYGADFTGGVRVAMADVTGDGVADLIVAPGPGTESLVKVYDGATHDLIASFDAYESTFTGGVSVAAADFTGDGKADIVTGADDGGGPRVRVFDGATATSTTTAPTVLDDFLAIDDANFRGGVRLAAGDLNQDGVADLVVAAGNGGGPRIAAFDGASLGRGEQVKLFADFFAFEPSLRNGANVSVGDVNGDGAGDMIFGGGPGGAPRVRVASGAAVIADGGGGSLDDLAGAQLANYFAGDSSSRDGVRVGITPSSDGTTSDVVALDVGSGALGVYSTDGQETSSLDPSAGGSPGFFACPPFDHSSYNIPPGAGGFGGSGSYGSSGSGSGSSGSGSTTTAVATHFALIAAPQTYTGQATQITVVALDASNHVVSNYTGTVTLTDTDTGATLPASYTFTTSDRGVHTFSVTPAAAGTETITATDASSTPLTGTVDLTVTTAPTATHFLVLVRPQATVGSATQVEVVALDSSNRVVPTYTGTVALTDTDTGATLPTSYTFTADDRGVHVFTLTPSAAGTQTITATDGTTASLTGTVDLTVSAAPVATRLAVQTRPAAESGRSFTITVAAVDASGRLVTNYTGTVAFTSTDAAATLPASYTFTAADQGVHTFTVTLATTGTQTVTATDGASLTGTTSVRVLSA